MQYNCVEGAIISSQLDFAGSQTDNHEITLCQLINCQNFGLSLSVLVLLIIVLLLFCIS